jgi:two-component system, OmpR family, sensor histidine kinase ChvG
MKLNSRLDPSKRWISRLTLRILAVNFLALAVLAGGVLYLDNFRVRLIEQRRESIEARAQLMAVALGEISLQAPEIPEIDALRSGVLINRLNNPVEQRVRLFRKSGQIITDTQALPINPEDIAPWTWTWKSWRRQSAGFLDRVIESIGNNPKLEVFREPTIASPQSFPEVAHALRGEIAWRYRRRMDYVVVISVAAPIKTEKTVAGAVLITADTKDIIEAWRAERLTWFYVFLFVLACTLLMSIFLSRTITLPLKRLAIAAERVKLGRGREVSIPKFMDHNDEIGDLASALSGMTQSLHLRMDAIEAFAADVSHELKNPLTSLRSAVDVLGRAKDPKVQQRLMDIITHDVQRLDRLISDISDASRLDAELSRAKMTPFDMRLMLNTLIDIYRTSKTQHKVKLIFKPPSEPVKVQGLELRLGQVVRNIIDNAISFSPPKGSVTLILFRQLTEIILMVEDEGPGIPDLNAEDIFKRFYSERPSDESFGRHSGLGLSISKQIIEAHDGRIWAENRKTAEGTVAGARFVIALPAA